MMKQKKDHSEKKQKSRQAQGSKHLYKFGVGIAVLIAYILYSAGMKGDVLQFDDIEYFTKYPEVLTLSWKNILKIFTSHHLIMYQPLPVLTFAINYHFTKLNTLPLHTINLVFHLINIVLVYIFTKKVVSSRNIALVVAVLFALHPLNAEVVYWISARSSGMYVCFYLLALIKYQNYVKDQNKVKYYLYSFLLFIPALLSKSQAVTLPLVLILLDFLHNRKLISARVITEKLPFLAMSVVFGLITLSDKGTMTNITNGMMIGYSGIDKICMACYSFCFYLFKLIIPANLCSIYVYPPKDGGSLPWEYYASVAVVLLLLFAAFKIRKDKLALFSILLFAVTISINIQLIPSRNFITADRYAYFPFIGLFILIASKCKIIFKEYQFRKYRIVVVAVSAVFLIFDLVQIKGREPVWQNDYNMMTDIIEKNPEVPYISRAYGNRGIDYSKKGEHQLAADDFTQALRIKPDDAQTYYNRGFEFLQMNQLQMARKDFDSAIIYEPRQAVIYARRAIVFYRLSDNRQALRDCNTALNIDSSMYDVYNLRAALFYNTKQYDSCLFDLNKSIQIKPDFSDAYLNRGLLHQQANRRDDACSDFLKASGMGNPRAKEQLRANCPQVPVLQ